jgi:hypothetical protein
VIKTGRRRPRWRRVWRRSGHGQRVAAPARMAELRVFGIDVSVTKEELRDTLVLAARCGGGEVQVGESGTSRSGLGLALVRCPLVGARKLAQAGKVALEWSIARVEAIAKRTWQCFQCLELDTSGRRAYRRWTGHTYVVSVAKLSIVLEAVLPRHASAPSASRSGHLRPLPRTGTHVQRRGASTRRRRPFFET